MPSDTSDRRALERAAEHAFAFLGSLDSRPVATTASLGELRARLARTLPDRGIPALQVIDELVADADAGILGSQSGRSFGWVIGGGSPAAVAADWLTTVWDQNTGIHACAPAASVVEGHWRGLLRRRHLAGPSRHADQRLQLEHD